MAEGHRQRLRNRFLEYGLDSFTDEEIVEMLLALGTPRKDCKKQARELCSRFGSLALVLEADIDELRKTRDIGPNNAFAVKFIHEVARRFLKQRLKERQQVHSAADMVDYLCHSLSFRDREIFITAFLDAANAVIDIEEVFAGTADKAAVYPREIMRKALLKNATGLIFAHNHPSGSLKPSMADREITSQLVSAAKVLGIRVLDHIIVGGPSDYFSFAENGLMPPVLKRGETM